MALVSVTSGTANTVLLVFRDWEDTLRLWLASPGYSRLLRFTGPATTPNHLVSTLGVKIDVSNGSFSLRNRLLGGGCSLSTSAGGEPEVPLSSIEQKDAADMVKEMWTFQYNEDYVSASQTDQRLCEFLCSELRHPFAVLRTLLEAYTALDWTSQTCTIWLLARIKSLLDQLYLAFILENKAVSPPTKQYLHQLIDLMTREDPGNERLGLFIKAYAEVIHSGFEEIAKLRPDCEELVVKKQAFATLRLLKGNEVNLEDIFPPLSLISENSLFLRSLSIELASEFPFSSPNSLNFLLFPLKSPSNYPFPFIYFLLVQLSHLACTSPDPIYSQIVLGSEGITSLFTVKDWKIRCAAYHSLLIILEKTEDAGKKTDLDRVLSEWTGWERDMRVKSFHRQRFSLRHLLNPSSTPYIDHPFHQLCTFSSVPGRAYVSSPPQIDIIEKDFLHPTSRITLTKTDFAIITGGIEHPTHSYEFSLVNFEYVRMSELNTGRFNHSIAVLDRIVYVSGGQNEDFTSGMESVEGFKGGKWESGGSMLGKRVNHAMTGWNHRLYVAGGGGSRRIDVFDGGKWQDLPIELPESLLNPAFLFISNDKILYFGGLLGVKPCKQTWEIDVVTGNRRKLPKLPISCQFPSNSVCIHNSYVLGLNSREMSAVELDLLEGVWRVWDEG